MWRGVSFPALHWQVALVKPGTLRSYKNVVSPTFLITGLGQQDILCFSETFEELLKACFVGGVISETTLRFPWSVLGRTVGSVPFLSSALA